MDAEYGRRYRDLYQRHWWWRAREAAVLETLKSIQPPGGWKRILDVGCGDGLFFDRLLELGDVEGIEPESDIVDPNGPHRDRIHAVPFDERFRPTHQYSLVLMLDVLEHLDDPVAALRHAVSLVEPGGRIVITVPAFMALWTTHDALNHHRTRYTRSSFRAVAARAGLAIDHESYWFQWTFPVKLAARAAEAVLRTAPAPPSVPPRWINASLYALSRAERRVLGVVRPPFGSSLMVVGRAANPKA